MQMKITVCEMHDERDLFARDWEKLWGHVKAAQSDLVLLPEMIFCSWFARTRDFDPAAWRLAVEAHEVWLPQLKELAPAVVLSTRPVDRAGQRINAGFTWGPDKELTETHDKYYLPDEAGFWEASWYNRGNGDFKTFQVAGATAGFLICTELWAMDQARAYGKSGAHLLVTPRATGKTSVEKWLVGGRAAAIVAGAYSISSNRCDEGDQFGGGGWIVDPDGEVLGVTTPQQPIITVDIDLEEAEKAKSTYPRDALNRK
jgi:N-carbamoylputrescine amidase